jgi:hypothetical protein
MQYLDYILSTDEDIVRAIQTSCADLAEAGSWDRGDGAYIAALFNKSAAPMKLFRYVDEKTGSSDVGYRTRDGREWFHILRQMRNEAGSGLLENLRA